MSSGERVVRDRVAIFDTRPAGRTFFEMTMLLGNSCFLGCAPARRPDTTTKNSSEPDGDGAP